VERAPDLQTGFHLVALGDVGSTNDEARRLAGEGSPDGTLVWARSQNAGRGRYGRTWTSPPGNLYLSILLRPTCAPAAALQLGFVAAVALGEALDRRVAPAALAFKWPNDVLLNGRKIAGILLESATGAGGVLDWLIIGMGANLASFPAGTAFPATSLANDGYPAATPAEVLEDMCRSFAAWRVRWTAEGFGPVRQAWLGRAWRRGQPIEIRLERERASGVFAGLDDSGALLLDPSGGPRRLVSFGEVFPASA
jgi:BirA family transcriptional regulator, biotin operon repressor / biotin---[acetyl-CoA-carboxylase] ligase